MPSLVNNFSGISGSASNISSNIGGLSRSFQGFKNPKSVPSASLQFANSAINLGGSLVDLTRSINGLFYVDRDVIKQNQNIMRGNHYISGYQSIPIPPFPSVGPFSPPNVLSAFLPPVANDVLGFQMDIHNQPLVEYDMENFKYSMDKPDDTDYFYEDPLYQSFDLIFDTKQSPLFNGEINTFFNLYAGRQNTQSYLYNAWFNYQKFTELFFKIFNSDTISAEVKRNKVWYINSVAGLDKLSAKIPVYETDKITVTLSEDISMLVNYMIDSYNNFAYNYAQQRYNLPDNLMRFKMMIRLSDMRTIKLQNHFENPEHMYDKAAEIYTLYDCNFDFFNSKNFGDEVINGGYGVSKQDTPATVKFDIIYKSIQKEFRTPLIKGERNTVLNNKEVVRSDTSLSNLLRNKLVRTAEQEGSFKDILSAAFGAATSVSNMLSKYIPRYEPDIPNVPNDSLGAVYENTNNQDYYYGHRGGIESNGNTVNNDNLGEVYNNGNGNDTVLDLKQSDILQPDSVSYRKFLIEEFTAEIKNRSERVLPTNIQSIISRTVKLGEDFGKVTKPETDPLGNVYQNNGTPEHDDLGFISLFLKPTQFNNLGNTYDNINFVYDTQLGFDYQNGETPTHGDLGVDFGKTDTPTHGDLGTEYLNDGVRVELNKVILYGKETTEKPILGTVYTNLSELKEIKLNTLYDNSVQRQQVSLGDLYSNLSQENTANLGEDYSNKVTKNVVSDIPNVYINTNVERESLTENVLFGKIEKPVVEPLSDVFINTNVERQPLTETTLFNKTDKPVVDPLSDVYVNTNVERESLTENVLFGKTEKPSVQMDSVYSNQLEPKTNKDLGTLYIGTDKISTQDMGSDFINNDFLKQNVVLDSIYDNTTLQKSEVLLNTVFDNVPEIKNKTDLNSLYNNEVNKTGNLDNESVYLNTVNKTNIDLGTDYNNNVSYEQKLDSDTLYEKPIVKSNEDLGDSYENNLIE